MSFPSPSPKQAKVIWLALTGMAVAVLAALGVALVWGLGKILEILSPVLWPLAVAGVLAYLLDPVVDFLEQRAIPRTRAIILVFIMAVVLLLGMAASVVPQLVNETRDLAMKIPSYTQRLRTGVERWANNPPLLLRKFLGREKSAATTTNAISQTQIDSDTTVTNALPASPKDATPASFWDQALNRDTLRSASGWLATVLPKIGSWLFGQVTRVAAWFGVLAGL